MAEISAGQIHHNATQEARPGCVGIALLGVQLRFGDEGEILVKSPEQMVGHYKRPELTAEVFTADGFFYTCDKGMLTDKGLLKLTGRVEEICKTSRGKYVAPAPIENQLNAHFLVEMVIVSGVRQPAAYAMVVPVEDIRLRLHVSAVRARVKSELGQLLQDLNSKLADYGKLQSVVIAAVSWSIENLCQTPTMKIKSSRIGASVEAQVPHWYASCKPVQWAWYAHKKRPPRGGLFIAIQRSIFWQ